DVAAYRRGLRNLLTHLGLLAGRVQAPEPRWVIEDDRPQAGFLQVQNRAPVGGLVEAEGEVVAGGRKGQGVGGVRGALGNVRHAVEATHSGLVVFLRTFPRVLAGDPVCTVLELR